MKIIVEEKKRNWRNEIIIAAMVVIAVIGGDLLINGLPGSSPPWITFESQEGNFSILFPKQPTQSTQILRTAYGNVNQYIFTANDTNGIYYTIGYTDIPLQSFENRTIDEMLDSATAGEVNGVGGTLISETVISINGSQGREVNISVAQGDYRIKSQHFFIGQRLYQLVVIAPKDYIELKDVRNFLDSFELNP